MELLIGIIALFVLRKLVKKTIKFILTVSLIPIGAFLTSTIFDISLFDVILIALVFIKVLREIIKKYKDIEDNISYSYEEYQNGYLEKVFYILLHVNLVVFWVIVGILSIAQIISPFANILPIEVFLGLFVLSLFIKYAGIYFSHYFKYT